MKLLLLLSFLGVTFAADLTDPSTCTSYPCTIFDDTFDDFDHDVWEHEVSLSGSGNWEFQAYINNRSVSYVRDSILYIKPQLTSEWQTEAFLSSGDFDLWGMNGRNDLCTGPWFYGCERTGTASNIVNPILSARLRTLYDFSFRYGRVEVVAKMPRGQWLWPAIWMLPQYFRYGGWPASGEIDIVESRGNDDYDTLSNVYAGTTMHWGPYAALNQYGMTQATYSPTSGAFPDAFHTWAVDWTADSITFSLDGSVVMTVDPGTTFWDYGGFSSVGDIDNPWSNGDKMAPFDQPFYFVINLAVGGTNGYFPDGVSSTPAKPWLNTSPTAYLDFWNGKDSWLPTWQDTDGTISEDAALQVDRITVYKTAADQISKATKTRK